MLTNILRIQVAVNFCMIISLLTSVFGCSFASHCGKLAVIDEYSHLDVDQILYVFVQNDIRA